MVVKRSPLEGRTVLLTGASSGIGRALAIELGRRGARVGLAARRAWALVDVSEEMVRAGAPAPVVLPCDLSRRGGAAALAAEATEALGEVDVLVNNAGVELFAAVCAAGDGDEARELFETNYFSPLALVRALVPAMRARRSGIVVNVASIAATVPAPLTSHYASSKGALALMTESLRMELSRTGVHVLLVLPGPVDTAMLAEGRVVAAEILDRSPRGTPEALAHRIADAIEARREVVVYPRWAALSRWLPTVALAVTRRVFRDLPVSHERVLRGGSSGDPEVHAARDGRAQLAAPVLLGGAS